MSTIEILQQIRVQLEVASALLQQLERREKEKEERMTPIQPHWMVNEDNKENWDPEATHPPSYFTAKGRRDTLYRGIVISADALMVLDFTEWKLHSRHYGKLKATAHLVESIPRGMCLISKTEVAVCLDNSVIEIMSFKSTRRIQRVNRLHVTTRFVRCDAVAKVESMDKLIVSGWDLNTHLYWCVVSLTDGHVDTIHHICKGEFKSGVSFSGGRLIIGDITGRCSHVSHLAIKNNTVYISCYDGPDSPNTGVYSYSIPNPNTRKFVYHHRDLKQPWGLTVDTRGYVFVCNWFPYLSIHQLTDRGELVTIHRLSSYPCDIFYEEQDGVLYTTGLSRNVITRYRLEYSHQQDSVIPAEVLKMDTRSLRMYKDALRDGKEKVYSVRVMVVGQYGVGKTTLTRRLLGKDVKISDRDSTEGIDIHTECCKVSMATGEWTTQEKNAEQYSRLQRLVMLLNERVEKQESEGEQEGQSELDDLVTSEEYDNVHPHHDQSISAEQGIDQEVKPTFSHSVETPVVRVNPEPSTEIGSNENKKKKDAVMEILQMVNENSGKLEKSMVEYAALALWDFAGQYVFYTTHQTFLTSRAIYLLVIDLSQQVTDFIKDDECFLDTKGIKLCKVHELIEIWLNSIHSCAPSSQASIPPVILVGTHVDKIPEKFRQKIINKYFLTIREMLGDKPAIIHLMDDIAIDNTQADPRLEDLKKRIFELAKQQPHWGEEKPARWLPLEQAIITLKMSGVKVAPLSLVEEINRPGSVRIEDRDELDLFLRFQHEMGTILYFSVEGLREKIMLDPQWMINAVKSLITAETFIRRNPAITAKWLEFKKKGKLTHELLDAIWSKEESPEFHDNKDHIILLMEKLNIIARPRTYGQDGKEVETARDINGVMKICIPSQEQSQTSSLDAHTSDQCSIHSNPGNTDIRDQIMPQHHDVRARAMDLQRKLYQTKGVSCSDPKLLCQVLNKSMQVASSSQSTLEENCLTAGLKFNGETPANGNCFFEAVSSQLQRLNCAVQKSPQQLRQDVVKFIKANRILPVSEGTIDLADFMDNETFDDYCVRMANDGEWADHVVVVAMARMLQTDIMIITSSPSTGPDDIIVWVVGQTDFQGQPILLGHVWEYHYQSLQPIASVSLEPVLAGSPAPAPTNVPPQAQKLASTPDATAGSMSSPAALTTLAITSGTMLVSTYDPMPSITADVMQAPSSSSTAASLMQAPTYGSTQSTTTGPMLFTIFRTTTADVMQTVTSSFTTDNVMQTPAYSYTPSTTAGPIPVPTSTFTPSTTAGHMQSATSTSTSSGLMPAQTSGSIHSTTTGSMPSLTSTSTPSTTAGHMLGATSTSTAAGLVPAPTYGSTQSMTTGPMPFTTFSATTANVMQTVTSSTTTAGIMQAPASGYTPSTTASPIPAPTTASLIPAPTTTSTPSPTAGHTQSATSTSTAAGLMPAPTYGSTQSMTTGPKPFPTFSATTADIMQYPASGCTPSTTAGPIPAPTSNCTSSPTAGHMQSATSTSTAAGLVPAPTSGSIPSPTSCSTPSTTGIGLAPTSSSTTADIAQAPTVDDADRFMHIACLLVNVGSRVLRRLLLHHTVTPACNLDQYLAKNRIAIDSLKKRRILNNSQMDILFPPGGTTNLGDYDITLLSALFNNIVSTITQQQLNMIQFLRDERNEIFAHARSITVNINDYQKFWNGIYTSLVALCKQCGDPDFENEILKEIQGIKMSTVQGTSFLDTLQTHPRRLETLERLVQALISSFTQESTRPSDDSDS